MSSTRRRWFGAGAGAEGGHLGRADGAQREPVVAAQEVLADRAGGPHRDVEARRPAVDALARPDVAEGVDEQDDVGVLVGVGRGDVQRAGAQRHRPAGSGAAGRRGGTARIVLNSLPEPGRSDRLRPTMPRGCGVGALASKAAGSGRVAVSRSGRSSGPTRKAPHVLDSAHRHRADPAPTPAGAAQTHRGRRRHRAWRPRWRVAGRRTALAASRDDAVHVGQARLGRDAQTDGLPLAQRHVGERAVARHLPRGRARCPTAPPRRAGRRDEQVGPPAERGQHRPEAGEGDRALVRGSRVPRAEGARRRGRADAG